MTCKLTKVSAMNEINEHVYIPHILMFSLDYSVDIKEIKCIFIVFLGNHRIIWVHLPVYNVHCTKVWCHVLEVNCWKQVLQISMYCMYCNIICISLLYSFLQERSVIILRVGTGVNILEFILHNIVYKLKWMFY